MSSFRKSTDIVQDSNFDSEIFLNQTEVQRFLQQSREDANASGVELTTKDYQKKGGQYTLKYMKNDMGNPIISGLKSLNSLSLVFSGKSRTGMETFNILPTATTTKVRNMTDEELYKFVVDTMGVLFQVEEGLKGGLLNAKAFYNLSKSIGRELKQGKELFNKYREAVFMTGKNMIKEWSNS